jgi:hypothetical protein
MHARIARIRALIRYDARHTADPLEGKLRISLSGAGLARRGEGTGRLTERLRLRSQLMRHLVSRLISSLA